MIYNGKVQQLAVKLLRCAIRDCFAPVTHSDRVVLSICTLFHQRCAKCTDHADLSAPQILGLESRPRRKSYLSRCMSHHHRWDGLLSFPEEPEVNMPTTAQDLDLASAPDTNSYVSASV